MFRWYAIHTRYKWEKKVASVLCERGIENYCPVYNVRRRWSDRLKMIEQPLFKSYVFVKIRQEQRTAVRMINGVLNFSYRNGKPAVIKEKQIEAIRFFLNEYKNIEIIKIADDNVQPMIGLQGLVYNTPVLTTLKNKRVLLSIKSIGYVMVAHKQESNLIPVSNR